ncbi:site-specific integrase [Megamonas hypermegale]|uniref:site-specific integrase n=1 Tax=Megamonas hypermegale TaxID=158847 RepID=UPI00320AC1C6
MPVYKNEQRGTWFTTFYYTDWTGTRKKKKKEGFTTKREAQAFEREFLERMAGSCDMSFASLVSIYLNDCKTKLKTSTYSTKNFTINKFIISYFKDISINKITPAHIRQWQLEIINTNLYSNQYLRYINTQLSCIFNYAIRYYNLSKNPVQQCEAMGSKKSKEIEFWTLDEFKKFISSVDDEQVYTIFSILFWTGIRRGELLALRPCDFDFDNNLLSIRRNLVYVDGQAYISSPKTEKSNRVINMPKFLMGIVKNHIEKNMILKNELLFEVNPFYLKRKMKKYANKSNVKLIRIHDLRHSHASFLIEQGFSPLMIAERLGHEDIQTTLKTYSHLYPNKQNELAEKIDELYNNI